MKHLYLRSYEEFPLRVDRLVATEVLIGSEGDFEDNNIGAPPNEIKILYEISGRKTVNRLHDFFITEIRRKYYGKV